MNEPITYPVGTGNVIGSHSAQDFVWAGRAESDVGYKDGTYTLGELKTVEDATHDQCDENGIDGTSCGGKMISVPAIPNYHGRTKRHLMCQEHIHNYWGAIAWYEQENNLNRIMGQGSKLRFNDMSNSHHSAETATHTPADTNTPYDGPITEPIGSDVQFSADGKNSWSMAKTSNYFIGICAIIAGTVSVLGLVSTPLMDDSLRGLGFGTYFKGVKTSWNSKDRYSKTLMLATFGTLIYLGAITSLYTDRYSGRTTMGQ